MLFVKCNIFVKAIVFFEFRKVISFSILVLRILAALRLSIFMSCFSLDLKTKIVMYTGAYQGVRNVRFLENLACFALLKYPF